VNKMPWTDEDAARAKEIRESSSLRRLTEDERLELRALRRREIAECLRIRRKGLELRALRRKGALLR
jgi:hypothetical protein